MDPDATARELGRRYVAGELEADELDARLTTLYAEDDAAGALAGLAARAPEPAPETRRRGWWRFRHGESGSARADWLPTSERFVDPTTQRVMRVWTDPATGGRHYVAEP